MYKVIIDTNILINSSHDSFSYAWKVINLVLTGQVIAYASEKILKENNLILDRILVNAKERQSFDLFLAQLVIAPVYHNVQVIKHDSEDDKFINCALTVKADYIITEDSHLLELEEYQGIQMVTPTDFWFIYQGETKDEKANREWTDWFKNVTRKK